MSRAIKSTPGRVVEIGESYGEGPGSQSWLCEAIRAVISRLYGQFSQDVDDLGGAKANSVHRTAVISQVGKAFGALLDEDDELKSVSRGFDIVETLGDVAHVGNGYYIPRESRVIRLTESWGYVAGGLPLDLSEHVDDGIVSIDRDAIGRTAILSSNYDSNDEHSEYSDVFIWSKGSPEQRYSRLYQGLNLRQLMTNPGSTAVYYNAKTKRAGSRRDRWQSQVPTESFVVARLGSKPAIYQVGIFDGGSVKGHWYELDKELARKWILLAEKIAGTINHFRPERSGELAFALPDMLPRDWTRAVMANSKTILPTEKGWHLEVKEGQTELLLKLLDLGNIRLL